MAKNLKQYSRFDKQNSSIANFGIPGYPGATFNVSVSRTPKTAGKVRLVNNVIEVVGNYVIPIPSCDGKSCNGSETISVRTRISGSTQNQDRVVAANAIHAQLMSRLQLEAFLGYVDSTAAAIVAPDVETQLLKIYPAKAA